MKKYKLLKDMPSDHGILKAGEIFNQMTDGFFSSSNGNTGKVDIFFKNNPEFFEEVTRWKPAPTELTWYVLAYGAIGNMNLGSSGDNIYEFGNCFKTREQAEHARDEIKKLLLKLHEDV